MKNKLKQLSSWWSGVSTKHYIVHKSSDVVQEQVGGSSLVASTGLGATNVLAPPVGSAPVVIATVQPDVLAPILSPIPTSAVHSDFGLGSLISVSPSEKALSVTTASLVCHVVSSVSSGNW